jgi:hypothetical protein
MWKAALRDPQMREYWRFAMNGVSVPHCDDWPAVRWLVRQGVVDADAVFMPGHTGDFISGGHLKYLFDPTWRKGAHSFHEALIAKHYSLWEDFLRDAKVKQAVEERIDEVVAALPQDSDADEARRYEYWEWQERQPKLILNSLRVYEFFDHTWRVPLWDSAVMGFWKRVPLRLKLDKHLYRHYLASHGPQPLFAGDAPQGHEPAVAIAAQSGRTWKGRVKQGLLNFGLTAPLARNLERHRSHLATYANHPTGFARGYGWFRYVMREPAKRHALSLLVKDVLEMEYGIKLSDVARGLGR